MDAETLTLGEVRQTCGCQTGAGSGMDWQLGVHRCQLQALEWRSSEMLLYHTGNSIQSLVMEKDVGKRTCVCVSECVSLCVCGCVCVSE